MDVKLVAYGLVIGLVLGGIGGYIINTSFSRTAALYNEIEALKTDRDHFSSQISDYDGIISDLGLTIEQYEDELSELGLVIESLSIRGNKSQYIETYFVNTVEATEKISNWIGSANESILVIVTMIYEPSLGEALVDAHERGIDVQVLMDSYYSSDYITESIFDNLIHWGVDARVVHGERQHEQTMIIDNEIVVLGSNEWGRRPFGEYTHNLVRIIDDTTTQKALEMFENKWNRTKSLLPVLEHLQPWPELLEGTVIISEIETDPAGDDANREWIELHNPWNFTIDISGYYFFYREMDYNYTFGQGTIIHSKEYFVHYLPVEVDNDKHVRIYLYNSEGERVDYCSISEETRDDDTSKHRIGATSWEGGSDHTKGRPPR